MRTDVLIIGSGLAGLVTASELMKAGKTVTVLEQEPAASFGGQSYWAFGGLFMIDTPEQRRAGIRDSLELARSDWFATAGFDGPHDVWAERWAEQYLDFSAGRARAYLREHGIGIFPLIGHAERATGTGTGSSVARFHIAWGCGPGVLRPFAQRFGAAVAADSAYALTRHRFEELIVADGRVVGARGSVLAPDLGVRGEPSNSTVIDDFEIYADHVVVATGGSGGSRERVIREWSPTLGKPPSDLLLGVPPSVDGRGIDSVALAGGNVVNQSRKWHYPEGLAHWDPIWPGHSVRMIPGPSSLWLDSNGDRLPAPHVPGADTLGALSYLGNRGDHHSWLILTQSILHREITLSGSEQNPDLATKNYAGVLDRALHGAAGLRDFIRLSPDVVTAQSLEELLHGMQALEPGLDPLRVTASIHARDRFVEDPSSDHQLAVVQQAREQVFERRFRTAEIHELLDDRHWPLVAIRMRTMSRKSLGGIQTNLDSAVLRSDGSVMPGLFAVGEAAGFGGGGMHGYRSLEGTFLTGCMATGIAAAHGIVNA